MDPRHDDIERYLNNQMSDAERHALEKRALSDPFLADAIEGAQSVTPAEFSSDVKTLHEKIKVPASPWKVSLRLAAGVVLAVALGWLIWRSPGTATETAPVLSERSGPVAADTVDQTKDQGKAVESPSTTEAKEHVAQAEPKKEPVAEATNQPAPVEAASGAAVTTAEPAPLAATKTDRAEEEAAPYDRKASAAPREKRLAPSSRRITGTVTEAEDNIPLADVVVRDITTQQETRTRGDGTYSLPVTTENPVVQYTFPGLQPLEQRAGNEVPLNVQLKDDAAQRSEVIAFPPSNWSSSTADDLRLAIPSQGMPQYREYLENNLVVPASAKAAGVSGKVTIGFTVDESGQLKDFHVVKGLGYGCEEEVIRLVKNGPSWNAAHYRKSPVASTVWVKLDVPPGR